MATQYILISRQCSGTFESQNSIWGYAGNTFSFLMFSGIFVFFLSVGGLRQHAFAKTYSSL